ncbi:MAG: hypothetical protein K0Q76_917 [Panacagrimonas sp.]|jgi:uncharacterized MAPEG superfamily protein|nr:MAPEG family protein [Panacagrimonas sp.]MCC2655809.1 hypothetical protein [Panacagrimonas sp.]
MTGIEALLYYVLWMIVLVLLYVGHRIPLVLIGKKQANYWTRGNTTDDMGWQVRAMHAHANTVENIGIFAAVVLVAAALDRSAVVDPLACWVLYARIGQSVVHLLGTGFIHVLIRATLFVVQLGIIAYWAWMLLQPATATVS